MIRLIALLAVLVLTSMSFVAAGAKTSITLEIYDGSNLGDFREIGFYSVSNGQLVRTPIVSASELRNINGPKTYTVDGTFSTSRMYVIGSNWGHARYFYTQSQYNDDHKDHFTTNGVYYWFQHNVDPYTGQCEYFNDYGFKIFNLNTYLETPECSDGIDNDHDYLIDAQDPGCWDNPWYPSSYNPQRDDESAGTSVCSTDADCGDGYICEYPGTGASQCVPKPDNQAPTVVLSSPQNNEQVTGTVVFEYTPTDDVGLAACELKINGVQALTNGLITNGAVNTFSKSFSEENVYITAQVVCYDAASNRGDSNTVTFFYGTTVPQCQDNAGCGEVTSEYMCDERDIIREVSTPTCTGGSCDTVVTEEFVTTCQYGCNKGKCIRGGGGNDNSYDDDTNNIPIIQTSGKVFEETVEVIYVEETVPVVETETKSRVNWFIVVLILLIIAIIIVLILIILVVGRNNREETIETTQEYPQESLY